MLKNPNKYKSPWIFRYVRKYISMCYSSSLSEVQTFEGWLNLLSNKFTLNFNRIKSWYGFVDTRGGVQGFFDKSQRWLGSDPFKLVTIYLWGWSTFNSGPLASNMMVINRNIGHLSHKIRNRTELRRDCLKYRRLYSIEWWQAFYTNCLRFFTLYLNNQICC